MRNGNASREEPAVDSLFQKEIFNSVTPVPKFYLIFGSLPYNHLRYSAREPILDPPIKPAYRGGDKVVAPDNFKNTPEAPSSREIGSLVKETAAIISLCTNVPNLYTKGQVYQMWQDFIPRVKVSEK